MVVNDSLKDQIDKDVRKDKWLRRFTSGKWWAMVVTSIVFPPFLIFVVFCNARKWDKEWQQYRSLKKITELEKESMKTGKPVDQEEIDRARDPYYDFKKEYKREKPYSWSWWMAGVGLFLGGLLVFPPLSIVGMVIAIYQSMKMTIDMLTPKKHKQ